MQAMTGTYPGATPPAQPTAGDGTAIIRTHAGYMRNEVSSFFQRWIPALRDTGEDVREAWTKATARAKDTIQNSGWIAGGIESACGSILGTGLRLTCQPDTTVVKFVGLTDDAGQTIDAEGWSRFVERRWQAYSSDPRECDARGRQTIADMARAQLKTWFATGEMVATIPHREEPGVLSSVKVLCLPPHRMVQRTSPSERIYQGVEYDEYGRPFAYLFQSRDRLGVERETKIFARDEIGRPQVIHVFEGDVTQHRGITPLAPALHVVRQYDQLSNATLMAALIQTIFAATVESDAPTMDVMRGLTSETDQGTNGSLEDFIAARMGWHAETSIDLGEEGKIAHLFPGEKLKFNRSEHPNTTYEAFARWLLREVARACGVTFEQLTGDYTGVTYTGVRMSNSEIWQLVMHRRKNIVAKFYQTVFEAWLEEEIETGRVKFPGGLDGFVRYRSAATRCVWRGPPKPQADDLKTAKAHQAYREMGIMSDEQIAAEIGDQEIGDVYAQRAREKELREKYKLDDMGPSTATLSAKIANGNDPDDPDLEDEDAA